MKEIHCPTCGTPSYSHPDRQVGEDALDIPDEVIERGVDALREYVAPDEDSDDRAIVVSIFKAMARDA